MNHAASDDSASREKVTGDKLLADLQAVVRDAEALLKATAGLAGDKIQEVRNRAEDSLKQARSRLEATPDDALRAARDMAENANSFVHESPWQAVGIAAGIGLVVGLILSRR